MRTQFDKELEVMHSDLIKMGVIVEEMIEKSIKALKIRDSEISKEIVEIDLRVDELEYLIENKCVELIALYQPVAKDLRKITSTLKIITDLERMGDYAVNIAQIILEMDEEDFVKPLVDLPEMAYSIKKMIHQSLDSFVNEDVDLAVETAKKDDYIDQLYERIYRDLLQIYDSKKSEQKQIIQLLLIGRYLERIADHNTNICERIIYMINGSRVHY